MHIFFIQTCCGLFYRLGPLDISLSDSWISNHNSQQHNTIQSPLSSGSSSSISLPLSSPAQVGGGLQSLSISQPPSQTGSSHSSQSKIMNAVAPACPPAATKKIRRKTENKVSDSNLVLTSKPNVKLLTKLFSSASS
jgi:hypothetical protein